MQIAILLYDGVTALDAIGPYEVLRAIPGADVRLVANERGPVRTDGGGLTLMADYALDEVAAPDIVVIPGTSEPGPLMGNQPVLEWIQRVHATTKWTTSVCTGALALGAAGLLKGHPATTHWLTLEMLRTFGAEPVKERVVRDGKLITAAGVSAGIDMALTLTALECGDATAQQIQLAIEYDPQPPFDAGSPDKAPPEITERIRSFYSNL